MYAGTADHLAVYGLLAPVAPQDVTTQVKVTSYTPQSTDTGVMQEVVVQNVGKTPLTGQVSLVVDGLGADYALSSAIGTTTQTTPRASFYLNLALTGGKLEPGASTTAGLKFVSAAHVLPAYTMRVLAGPGAR